MHFYERVETKLVLFFRSCQIQIHAQQILVLSGCSSGIIMLMVLNDEEFDVVLVMVLKTLVG